MAHYAFIDKNNVVVQVMFGVEESEQIEGKDPEDWYSEFTKLKCKKTSYSDDRTKRYPGIGYFYNEVLDICVPPKPFESWELDANGDWQPPTPYPDVEGDYMWDEEKQQWNAV